MKLIAQQVASWDEYGQGYDQRGRLIVCVCGAFRSDADWSTHDCPYDKREEGEPDEG